MSLIKVKVLDSQVINRSGVSKAGKPYSINSQENIVFELNGEVRKVAVNLRDGVSAYAPGLYTFDPSSCLKVGRFGFEFDNYAEVKLVQVQSATVTKVA